MFQTNRCGYFFTSTYSGYTPNSVWNITLGFAEIYTPLCVTGGRVFDVAVNGGEFISNLDIFDVAGCMTAKLVTKAVQADEYGRFLITFDATADNALISLIEITPLEEDLTPLPTNAPVVEPTTPAPTSAPVAAPMTPVAPVADPVVYVDAGADGENTTFVSGWGWTYSAAGSISGAGKYDEAVFLSHRSGQPTYTFTGFEPSSEWSVTLGFAEIYTQNCDVGKRIFDVRINGEDFTSDLDVFAVVGCTTAYVVTKFFAADNDGQLKIEFTGKVDYPMISLIEIIPLESAPTSLPMSTPVAVPVAPLTSAPVVMTKVPSSSPVTTAPSPSPVTEAPEVPTVFEFKLIYTPDGSAIADLVDGAVVSLSDLSLPEVAFNIEAVTSDDDIKSVLFQPNGKKENAEPFTFCGDNAKSYFTCPELTVGSHTISARAFTKSGKVIPVESVSFAIIEGPA